VRTLGDRAAQLARSAAPVLLSSAEALHSAYRAALEQPAAWAGGGRSPAPRDSSAPEAGALVERSVRAELAVALGVSERVATRELEHARLLIEELPRTRAALAAARIRWEAGQAICAVAATLPASARAVFDERTAELALTMTPTQLRRAAARLRDELHDQPLAERHARAREDRGVWLVPEEDGMATLRAHVPAPIAVGALARLDRIARSLRDSADGDPRTLAQLRADAWADLLCHGDVAGTAPSGGEEVSATFVPGIRAEVRLMLPASTASGAADDSADLDGYGAIPAETARELAGQGTSFTRVLTDAGSGAVLSVGRTHRLPPPRLRLLLQLRDRTCRFPGCIRPASSSEADHAVEWRNGGTTSSDNLLSLCVGHHHVRHGDRWTYVLHPDGTADWTTPTGRKVTTRPPAYSGVPAAGRSSPVDTTPS
jgi:hypothetical protein